MHVDVSRRLRALPVALFAASLAVSMIVCDRPGGPRRAGRRHGIELRILHRLEREGKVPAGALRVIAQRPVQGYPWVMRAALGETARATLTEAFLSIQDATPPDLVRAKRYIAVTAADYESIRRAATDLGLLTVKK
jgi:hypothetical protein